MGFSLSAKAQGEVNMTDQFSPGNQRQSTSRRNQSGWRKESARTKARIRAIVALALLSTWGLAVFSGLLLYVAPSGPRSGRTIMLILTKSQWSDLHFWVSMAAVVLTVVHMMIDWRALKACVRHLVSIERVEQL